MKREKNINIRIWSLVILGEKKAALKADMLLAVGTKCCGPIRHPTGQSGRTRDGTPGQEQSDQASQPNTASGQPELPSGLGGVYPARHIQPPPTSNSGWAVRYGRPPAVNLFNAAAVGVW